MNATLMIELNPEAWNGHHIWILASGCRPRFTGRSAQPDPEIEVMLLCPILDELLHP
jgi:hypothetical protein